MKIICTVAVILYLIIAVHSYKHSGKYERMTIKVQVGAVLTVVLFGIIFFIMR